MNGSMPAPVPPPRPHAAVIVHEVFGRLEHQHRVTARVAMEHEVDGAAPVMLLHVARVEELLLHLDEHAGAVAVRATGAERRGAQGDANVKRVRLADQFDGAIDAFLVEHKIRDRGRTCRAARGAR